MYMLSTKDMPTPCYFLYIRPVSILSNGCVRSVKREIKAPLPTRRRHSKLSAMPFSSGERKISTTQTNRWLRIITTQSLVGSNGRTTTTVQDNSGLMSRTLSPDGRYVGRFNSSRPKNPFSIDFFPSRQFLCADPSSGHIPGLQSYLVSELSKTSSTSTAQMPPTEQMTDIPSWLFPEKAETIIHEKRFGDWEKDIEILLQNFKVSSIDDGSEENGKKRLSSAPLGLKNRWRIWKILESITLSD